MDQSAEHLAQIEFQEAVVEKARHLLSIEESDQRVDNPYRYLGSGDNVSIYSLGDKIAARVYDHRMPAERDKAKLEALKEDGFPVPNVQGDVISGKLAHILCVDEINAEDWSRLPMNERIQAYGQMISILHHAIETGWEPIDINIGNNAVWDADRKKIVVLDIEYWKRFSEEPDWILKLADHLGGIKDELEKQKK